jgi:TetR/AcrR family transcriptional regulator, mexJK operon transcriptional repressor
MILSSIKKVPAASDSAELRRAAIVAAARTAFFHYGYGATAMSSIAATVGGSKTTLWAQFPSKQALFTAVIDDILDRYGVALSFDLNPADDLSDTLTLFASALMATILSSPIIDLHRIVHGEAGRFPELAALFWSRGPARGKARLAAYFDQMMADGRVRPGDPHVAARQFVALCQSGCFQQVMLALEPNPGADAIARDIAVAVDTFVRAWGCPAD